MRTPPNTLENCSISKKILDSGEFYELDFLASVVSYLRPDTTYIDVGAHIGNHTAYLLQSETSARGIAFEANPQTCAVLKQNCIDLGLMDRVTIIESAVGEKIGSGVLAPIDPEDVGTMSLHSRGDSDGGTKVDIVTIDRALKSVELHPVSIVKIDAEGSEKEIICGAAQTIKEHRPIICAESRSGGEFKDVATVLEPLGYVPVGVYNATPTVIWEPRDKRLVLEFPPLDIGQAFKYGIEMALEANNLATRLRTHELRISAERKSNEDALTKEKKALMDAKIYQVLARSTNERADG